VKVCLQMYRCFWLLQVLIGCREKLLETVCRKSLAVLFRHKSSWSSDSSRDIVAARAQLYIICNVFLTFVFV
jgi:hypothetical protein